MAQDYNLQLENIQKLKATLNHTIENLQRMRHSYATAVDSLRQSGLSTEMYQRLKGQNIVKMTSAISSLIDKIESDDIAWVNRLIEGLQTAMEVAGTAATSSASSPGSMSKEEKFRKASEKVKEMAAVTAALQKKADDAQPQNQRDMHADYIAAFLNNNTRSR